jgi:TolA-binding protein
MEVERLKKKLLQEELKRRRRNSPGYRIAICLVPLVILTIIIAAIYYYATLDERLHKSFARAEKFVLQGKYEAALGEYLDIYEDHPRFVLAPNALFRAGEVQNLFLKRFHDALLLFHNLERDYPDSPFVFEALRQEAAIYKNRLRDYGRAAALYQKLLDLGLEPADRFQYELSDCYFRLNNFEQARIEFENLLKGWPESDLRTEVEYRIGMSLALDGKLKDAEKAFRTLLKEKPDDPFAVETKFSLASVLEEQERLRESLKVLQELVGIYPAADVLQRKIEKIEERIKKKKRAV